MRAAIARRMVQSKREAPHFYVSTEVELGGLLALAGRLNGDRAREDRLTVTAFLRPGARAHAGGTSGLQRDVDR